MIVDESDAQKDVASNKVEESATTMDSQPKSKGKRKTSAQRRRDKYQKLRLEQQKQCGLDDTGKDDRVIEKDNPIFVKYYKLQSIVSQDEFDLFMEGLRTTLPASFRINAFDYGQARVLKKLVQGSEFQEFLKGASTGCEDQLVSSEAGLPVLEPLTWYPKKLAWQMNVTRNDLKKVPILQKLHRFIMAETDNGFISRQESVSMIPPLVLDIRRGQKILDMCAAPGSKTAQLLEYLKFDIFNGESWRQSSGKPQFDDGLVVANDVDNKRCYMLVHQSNRLNSPNCVIINEDASKLPKMKTLDENGYQEITFDRILCDAPCSGDGTLRKNPDVWRKWSIGNANNFHGLQSNILRRGVELLSKDGLIVYSTCSMNPVEDEAVVASILRMAKGSIELQDCSERLRGLNFRPGLNEWIVMNRDVQIVKSQEEVKPEQHSQIHSSLFPPSSDEIKQFNLNRCVRILPHVQNTGAFFIAVLKKLKDKLPWEAAQKSSQDDKLSVGVEKAQEPPKKTQPNPKKRRYGGFREDPFIFMESTDQDWIQIKNFYGLDENFPVNQLVHRCPSGKKRNIHLVSKATREFMLANCEQDGRTDFVKLINGGMRLFAKAETEAGFRISQDGINEIFPYLKSDLKVPVTKDDLRLLLARQSVPMEELSSGTHFKEKLKQGSCVLIYRHDTIENDDNSCDFIEMPLVAWRGERSMTLYVSKTYRVHLCAMIDMKLSDLTFDEVNNRKEIKSDPPDPKVNKQNDVLE